MTNDDFYDNRRINFQDKYQIDSMYWFNLGYSEAEWVEARINELKEADVDSLLSYIKWRQDVGTVYVSPSTIKENNELDDMIKKLKGKGYNRKDKGDNNE